MINPSHSQLATISVGYEAVALIYYSIKCIIRSDIQHIYVNCNTQFHKFSHIKG